MSNAAALKPLFSVLPSKRSPEENIKALAEFCHVVEVSGPWALVHASPMGVANIAQRLSLEVFPAKRGTDYYAIRVGVARLGVVAQSAEPSKRPSPVGQPERVVIRGLRYAVRETRPKRQIDVRRFEVRKLEGDAIDAPYVVAFQDPEGRRAACSCPDWKFRRSHCKHIQALQARYAG